MCLFLYCLFLSSSVSYAFPNKNIFNFLININLLNTTYDDIAYLCGKCREVPTHCNYVNVHSCMAR